eukprot:SAG22_NODE_3543_length_1651_cov_1.594716_1_plen_198_part_00
MTSFRLLAALTIGLVATTTTTTTSAAAADGARPSFVQDQDASASAGCGWSRCVKCQGGPCTPENQKCIGNVPKYTFHLADPTCDINDPSERAAAPQAPAFSPGSLLSPDSQLPPASPSSPPAHVTLRLADGPFYDPVHKLYHLFYQIHIALDMGGAGDGPDWGHWVSKVLMHCIAPPLPLRSLGRSAGGPDRDVITV